MGQYHITVNLDKREYLNPHELGDGLKLVEQGLSGPGGIPTAIHVLLAVSNGRGGGDYNDGVTYGYGPPNEMPDGAQPTGAGGDDIVGWVHRSPFADLADEVVGRWGGDRIAIIGDYAEDGDLPQELAPLVYTLCHAKDEIEEVIHHSDPQRAKLLRENLDNHGPFTNITPMVREYLVDCDGYYHTFKYTGDGWMNRTFDLQRRAGV